MNLYLVSQVVNKKWNTYDSIVVAAKDKYEAARISPSDYYIWDEETGWNFIHTNGKRTPENNTSWVLPSQVKIKYLGVAVQGISAGVICVSFNAG